jgi:hypothetical protein
MSMKKAYIKWPLIDMMEKNCKWLAITS